MIIDPIYRILGYEIKSGDKPSPAWMAVSFLTLRRVIGLMGVSFPIILALGYLILSPDPAGIKESISAYYGTNMRDVFVGVLFTIGWFLFSYKGYENRDDMAGDLACLFALGVALFPTTSELGWVRTIHFASAAALFMTLAYFSMVLFTLSDGNMTTRKKTRNRVYKICGWVMLACIALIVVYKVFLTNTAITKLDPVFWLETFALWAFGVSWMTKGKILWDDLDEKPAT